MARIPKFELARDIEKRQITGESVKTDNPVNISYNANESTSTSPSSVALAAQILDSPKIDKGYTVLHIKREQIKTNAKNNFPITDIESLAETIFEEGLAQPLHGIYNEDDDCYYLEGGERRFTALSLLMERYQSWIEKEDDGSIEYLRFSKHLKPFLIYGIPFHRKDKLKREEIERLGLHVSDEEIDTLNNVESEIRLKISNVTQRHLDAHTTALQTKELEELYRIRNNYLPADKKIKNINKQLSEDMGVTTRQIITQKNYASLHPELQKIMQERGITIFQGSKYHNLDAETQLLLVELLRSDSLANNEVPYTADEIKLMHEKIISLEQSSKDDKSELSDIKQKYAAAQKEIASLSKEEKKVIKVLPKQAKILKLEAALTICINNASAATTALKNAMGTYLENVNEQIIDEYKVISITEMYEKISTICKTYNDIMEGEE